MKVSLTDAGKRYNRDWIFRHLHYTFEQGKSYAITGPNGSGKSTLLQVISGAVDVNEGRISWSEDGGRESEVGSPGSGVRRETSDLRPSTPNSRPPTPGLISIAAPYLEVIEEMTALEFLTFHQVFKPFVKDISIPAILERVGLEKAADKQIRFFSSGMKQRIKLAQAFYSDVPILLLDEPCTNLDAGGISLYQQLIAELTSDRLVVVSSNDEVEFGFCTERVSILDYKV
ncbi:MAG: ABC transporter ATP-binding protein [Sphingobacteriales bacterium 12-47-4]|nr:MAG: ABC transporter ATP-binding protein [Sphingobacteriales bacterium 12-47-4]